ncbi:G-protein coupled receptors family 1 profile domain-containing protein [Caenorhabditis elegans]|uniref:G-protein coupled receptors family 1 profile domain-containing protein n=1 Tax=Caenorhabditis elegans TaxID=6239 RepID=O17660_CAEEL|nr:G-protein coupled receptors family 1 profile domain-containing protein [Caenorhabditis elegans]CAB02832.3 G-protein coupled receptors family 1 profile domain-containing protein [Caenorhabditis elegans]|eukprot:NP_506763.2 Serpentine Receptor, class W [Caenorhabditis elegans]
MDYVLPIPTIVASTANPNDYYGFVYNEYDYDFLTEQPKTRFSILGAILDFNIFTEIVAIVLCLLHLMILFRKSLRKNGVFVFMIAICISDILNFSLALPNDSMYYKYSWYLVPMHLEQSTFNITRRLSIWLAMVMALLRFLSVAFPMNYLIQKLVKPKNTVFIIFVVLAVIITYDAALPSLRISIAWFPDVTRCVVKSRHLRYVLIMSTDVDIDAYSITPNQNFVERIYRVLQFTLYPLLTISLLIQLCIIKKKRKAMRQNENQISDNTTLLILTMTFTFMFSEGLIWIWIFIDADDRFYYHFDLEYQVVSVTQEYKEILVALCFTFRIVNSISHILVSIMMSSHCRDTVKSIVFWGKIAKLFNHRLLKRKVESETDPITVVKATTDNVS